MTTIPTWLRQHLETTGALRPDRVARTARAQDCNGCGHVVLVGLDAEVASLRATTDLEPLSPMGEALAVLADRLTYSVHHAGSRLELERRDSFAMKSPAGSRVDVVAQHRCGAPPLPSAPTVTPLRHLKETPTCPPF